jgi:hypothetical protein
MLNGKSGPPAFVLPALAAAGEVATAAPSGSPEPPASPEAAPRPRASLSVAAGFSNRELSQDRDRDGEGDHDRLGADALLEMLLQDGGGAVGGGSASAASAIISQALLGVGAGRGGRGRASLGSRQARGRARAGSREGGGSPFETAGAFGGSSSSDAGGGGGIDGAAHASRDVSRALGLGPGHVSGNFVGHGLGGHGAGLGLPTILSSGRLSRGEADFDADETGAAAADQPDRQLEALAEQYAALVAELAEARGAAALQQRQLEALKEALREAERAQARLGSLGGGVRPEAAAGAGGGATAEVTGLTYLKNAVVAFMLARETSERRRMLPAIALLLRLSPQEAERVAAAIGAEGGGSSGGTPLGGKRATGAGAGGGSGGVFAWFSSPV